MDGVPTPGNLPPLLYTSTGQLQLDQNSIQMVGTCRGRQRRLGRKSNDPLHPLLLEGNTNGTDLNGVLLIIRGLLCSEDPAPH